MFKKIIRNVLILGILAVVIQNPVYSLIESPKYNSYLNISQKLFFSKEDKIEHFKSKIENELKVKYGKAFKINKIEFKNDIFPKGQDKGICSYIGTFSDNDMPNEEFEFTYEFRTSENINKIDWIKFEEIKLNDNYKDKALEKEVSSYYNNTISKELNKWDLNNFLIEYDVSELKDLVQPSEIKEASYAGLINQSLISRDIDDENYNDIFINIIVQVTNNTNTTDEKYETIMNDICSSIDKSLPVNLNIKLTFTNDDISIYESTSITELNSKLAYYDYNLNSLNRLGDINNNEEVLENN